MPLARPSSLQHQHAAQVMTPLPQVFKPLSQVWLPQSPRGRMLLRIAMKALLLQSLMQGLTRTTLVVVTMSALHCGIKDPGRVAIDGEGIVQTGIALRDHHAKAVGRVRTG